MNRFKQFDLEELGIIEAALEDFPAGPTTRQEILSLLGEILHRKTELFEIKERRTARLRKYAQENPGWQKRTGKGKTILETLESKMIQ